MTRVKDFKYNFILICFGIFLIGGNALSVTIVGVTIRIGEIALALLAIALLRFAAHHRMPKALQPILIWAVFDVVLVLVNTLIYGFTFTQFVNAVFYLLRFLLLIFVAYYSMAYIKKRNRLMQTLKFINFCYLVICLIGFYQLIFYPVAFEWYALFEKIGVYWDGDPHINRLISTDFDPNYTACCLLLGFVIDTYLIQKEKKLRYYILLLVYLAAILLTNSRSGMVGLVIVIVLSWLLSADFKNIRMHNIIFVLLSAFAFLYLLCFSNITTFVRIRSSLSDASAAARFASWDKSWQIIKNTFGLGVGYNLFGAYNQTFYDVTAVGAGGYNSGVDSSLLLILITSGVLGIILFLIHFVLLYKQNRNVHVRA